MLLNAPEVMQDSLQQLDKKLGRLVDAQLATDERLNALSTTVDGIIHAR